MALPALVTRVVATLTGSLPLAFLDESGTGSGPFHSVQAIADETGKPLGTAPAKDAPTYADYLARKAARAVAQALVSGASAELQDLAQRRTGYDAEGQPYTLEQPVDTLKLLPDPGTIPAKISSRQFFWALYKRKFINKEEAMAAIKAGTTPPLVVSILAGIPGEARDDAEALIMGAMDIERANPSTQLFGGAVGMTQEEIDLFFAFAITL